MRTGQSRISYSKLFSVVDEDLQSRCALWVEFKGRLLTIPLSSFALMQRGQGVLNMQNVSFHSYVIRYTETKSIAREYEQ